MERMGFMKNGANVGGAVKKTGLLAGIAGFFVTGLKVKWRN